MTKYKNPQEWLNEKHSDKSQTEVIIFSNLEEFEQSGELVIDGYIDLWRIGKIEERRGYIEISNITKLTISNCLQLEEIDISHFKDNQELIIDNCPSLKELYCSNSQLTTLDLSKLANLQSISCFENHLVEIKLPNPGEKLENLWLYDNNFKKDLSFLSHLVNLKTINLGNWNKDKINQGNCNRFYGSLEPLKNLSKLEELDISNTDVNDGLEYLTEDVGINCLADKRPIAKVKSIYNLFANEQGIVETEAFGWIYGIGLGQKNQEPSTKKEFQVQKEQKTIKKAESGNKELQACFALVHQISLKKSHRQSLLNQLNPQNNPNITFWLNELISMVKKPNNPQDTILENIQSKLTELGINQEQINELTKLQQEISRLKRELQLEVEQNQQTQIIHNPPKSS